MPTYDDDHARRALAKLIDIGAGSLAGGSYEIQDDGEFVMLTTQVTLDLSKPELAELCDRIKERLSSELPKRKGDYPWMVILRRHDGWIVDSVIPDM
jgi:hypothetical protein